MRILRSVIFLLVFIGLLWLAVLLISKAFTGNKSTGPVPKALVSYANTDATTELYVDGPVVANQEHQALRISVSQYQVQVNRMVGYDGQVVDQQTFPNTQASYASFLSSLQKLGFGGGPTANGAGDDRGTCPFGNRYVYTLSTSGSEVMHSWTSSCGGGTYPGNRGNTRQLFVRQIPESAVGDLTRNMSL